MLYRIDYFYERVHKKGRTWQTKRKPSDYMKSNIFITTSGLPWAPAITMAQSVLGMDRVLYAMDYPYQFVPEEVTMTDNFPISDADKKKLFQTNAKRFSLCNSGGPVRCEGSSSARGATTMLIGRTGWQQVRAQQRT